ncbi:hypothetical protein CBS101457_000147 [Exobasidium rhododendri]|nr:hypothetical protein CBS101457_000147 [Exobasidium rhododendri]
MTALYAAAVFACLLYVNDLITAKPVPSPMDSWGNSLYNNHRERSYSPRDRHSARQSQSQASSWLRRVTESDHFDSTADSGPALNAFSPGTFDYAPPHEDQHPSPYTEVPASDPIYQSLPYLPDWTQGHTSDYSYDYQATPSHPYDPHFSQLSLYGVDTPSYLDPVASLYHPDQYPPEHHGQSSTVGEPQQSRHDDIHASTSDGHREKGKAVDYETKSRQNRISHQKVPGKKQNAWFYYRTQLKEQLSHVLHLYSGLLKESIARKCRERLTDEMKETILSGNEKGIMDVLDVLFPPDPKTRMAKYLGQEWMRGMRMEQSIVVVNKMAEASGKDPEHVRNFFLRLPLAREDAWKIFHATTGDVCHEFVLRMGLDRPCSERTKRRHSNKEFFSKKIEAWPWMGHVNMHNRKLVVDKMKRATGFSMEDCYMLLSRPQTHEFTGLRILAARNNADIIRLVQPMVDNMV